jgi:hypothetical protein
MCRAAVILSVKIYSRCQIIITVVSVLFVRCPSFVRSSLRLSVHIPGCIGIICLVSRNWPLSQVSCHCCAQVSGTALRGLRSNLASVATDFRSVASNPCEVFLGQVSGTSLRGVRSNLTSVATDFRSVVSNSHEVFNGHLSGTDLRGIRSNLTSVATDL